MAVHGQPEPPRTLAAWHRFQEECWRQQRYDWLPKADVTGHRWAVWSALTPDHPFKGSRWCWRCVAEAIGSPDGSPSHISSNGTICWGPAEGDTRSEDREQDRRPPGDESSSDWTEAGRRYVAEAVDTGTIFYDPPPEPPPSAGRQVVEGQVWLAKLDAEGKPVGPPLVAGEDGFITIEESGWHGFPSWTDDPETEPAESDFSQWPPSSIEIAIPPDQVDAAIKALIQSTETDQP